jgi:hypothetical protein
MIELVPASLKHVGPIATRMRAADVEETGAMGRTPKQALRLGLRASVDCMTVLIDGRPEAMLGLTPKNLLEGEGMAWMLGNRSGLRQCAGVAASCPANASAVGRFNAPSRRFSRQEERSRHPFASEARIRGWRGSHRDRRR